jgi:DNA-binding MarR family transcriptional regulator
MDPGRPMSLNSTFPAADPEAERLTNLVGAWAMAVTDRVTAATVSAAGRGGQAPAAVVALHQFAGGCTIERLRHVLGLTHSAAVRLVDGLVADGHVSRDQGAGDRRSVRLRLTPRGRAVARKIAHARREAVAATLADLSDSERRALTAVTERLTANLTELRLEQRARGEPPEDGWLCRLCDMRACGRPEGRCPVAARAAAR